MRRLAVVVFWLAASAASAQTVWYVDADAAPGGNGTSWAQAFRDLQQGLSAAQSGHEVWVAEGVYKPTAGTDRSIAFVLRPGVRVFGGFAGTETQ
ncbi:MAG TPA: hypothetical protein VD962_05895, partial [Rubricoccaceae bacterium]|nr:hypothetical protein [Rubricoccaceae bacterium]